MAVDGGDKGNKAGTILQQVEKSVRSPLDDLIDQVVDYTQDMPKALMMADDDVKEANDYFLTQTVIGVSKQDNKKKMKFGMLRGNIDINIFFCYKLMPFNLL